MTREIPNTELVEAEVNYLLHDGRRPVTYAYPPPAGVPERTGIPDPRRVQIANARLLPEPPTLDVYGFQLGAAHTAFEDPTSRADAPPRRSIELRSLVFFE